MITEHRIRVAGLLLHSLALHSGLWLLKQANVLICIWQPCQHRNLSDAQPSEHEVQKSNKPGGHYSDVVLRFGPEMSVERQSFHRTSAGHSR